MDESIYADVVVTCPYNKNHKLAKSRIQRHLVKCEKNYPKDYKIICPFNATHRLFKHEMTEHVATCPTRKLIEPELYKRIENRTLLKNKLQYETTDLIKSNENWDEELRFVIKENLHPNKREDHSKYYKDDDEDLRAPRGYSEAMLIDIDEKTCVDEDMESISSSMGVGRGKFNSNKIHLLKRIGLGRGKFIH